MSVRNTVSRRGFLRNSIAGGAALAVSPSFFFAGGAYGAAAADVSSRVALTTGDDRTDNIFRGLKTFEKEIIQAIGSKRVVIKPNNVSTENQLASTHAGCLEGILEFLHSIGQKDVIIAESSANAPTIEGYENFGYIPLAEKYKATLVDLDAQDYEILYCVDQKRMHPHPCRMSSVLLDPNNFIISAAMPKAHDRVVATLSLKNIVVGAPIKDPGFRWSNGKPGAKTDKHLTHGDGFKGVNYNLFALASRLHPDLSVIDGHTGLEGNGPVSGEPVEHRIALVGLDWLAADRVGVELMGVDFSKVGYLNFCASAGMGQADLNKIEIIGPELHDHIRTYQLHQNLEQQLEWML